MKTRFLSFVAICMSLFTVAFVSVASATVTNGTLTADVQVRSDNPNNNYGTDPKIPVEGKALLERNSFLKFNVTVPAGETVTNAKVRVWTETAASTSTVDLFAVSNTTWIESGTGSVTFNTQPTMGLLADQASGFALNSWVEFDVTPEVTATGTYSFGLSTAQDRYIAFHSKENVSTNKAQLVVTSSGGGGDTTPPVVTLTAPSAGTISGTINLGATATDDTGTVSSAKWFYQSTPSAVEIGYDGIDDGWSDTWDTTTVADGTYTVYAKASDPTGNWGTSSSVNVTVDNVVEGNQVVAAVGDICGNSTCTGNAAETATTITNMNPYRFLGLGDYQYQNAGTNGATFQSGYRSKFGSLAGITVPVFGSTHDTCDGSGSWECYPVSYFNTNGAPEALGLLSDHQWGYSFDIGNWHVIAINYNVTSTAPLIADLNAHPSQCLMAIVHAPVYGSPSSSHSTNQASWAKTTLLNYGVDLILNGHQHFYERGSADGLTWITSGQGGVGHYTRTSTATGSQAYNATSFGVVKATLGDNAWSTEFVKNASAAAFTDTASGDCQ